MNIETTISRDHYKQLRAKSQIMLDTTKHLTISTSKSSGGNLCTHASVGHVKYGSLTHMIFQDFSEWIAESRPSRVTEKVIKAQHDGIDFDALIAKAKAFYNI